MCRRRFHIFSFFFFPLKWSDVLASFYWPADTATVTCTVYLLVYFLYSKRSFKYNEEHKNGWKFRKYAEAVSNNFGQKTIVIAFSSLSVLVFEPVVNQPYWTKVGNHKLRKRIQHYVFPAVSFFNLARSKIELTECCHLDNYTDSSIHGDSSVISIISYQAL